MIANLHEMSSHIKKIISLGYTKKTIEENYSKILTFMLPIIPHFTSECLSELKIKKNMWPEVNREILLEYKTNILVQINGKIRNVFETAKDIQQEELLDIIKKDNNLSKYLNGVKIKNVIYIKNKLINIIT